eukprot:11285311-Ditylum_brightwellii.AAC.1
MAESTPSFFGNGGIDVFFVKMMAKLTPSFYGNGRINTFFVKMMAELTPSFFMVMSELTKNKTVHTKAVGGYTTSNLRSQDDKT